MTRNVLNALLFQVYIRLYDKPLPSEQQIEELDTGIEDNSKNSFISVTYTTECLLKLL